MNNNRTISDIDKLRTCLFKLNMTNEDAAKEIGRSNKHVAKIIKEMGWTNELAEHRERVKNNPAKYVTGLEGFSLWVKRSRAKLYNELMEAIVEYTRP